MEMQKFMMDKKLRQCLEFVFNKEKIPKQIDKLKFGDFKTWDSLNHLNLLMQIEKKMKLKFTLEEMLNIKSIKDIKYIIKKK